MTQSDPQSPNNSPSTQSDQDLASRLETDGSAFADSAKHDLDEIAARAAADARAIQERAGDEVAAAADKAKSFAGEQKNFVAEQINGIADAIAKVAEELDQTEQRAVGRYARDLAGGLSGLGRQVQDNDVDALMAKGQRFGQQQPLAFLGAAALAGFLASRFAMASAHRSQQAAPTGGEPDRTDTGGQR